jgi:putative chitinase
VIAFDRSALNALTPNAQPTYEQALDRLTDLSPFGVLDSKLRADHFLSQILHETGGLHVLVENLNYSAARLMVVWPSRFKTLEDAKTCEHNPRALANRVYGGRMGNLEDGDGWRYIGRGLLQLTGRSSYARAGAALGLDLVGYPSLAIDPAQALRVAGCEWHALRCNEAADANDVELVTRRVNGGAIGLLERATWLQKVRAHNIVTEKAVSDAVD